jgi:hypothetical protein
MSLAVKNLRLAMAGREAAIAGPPGRFRSFPETLAETFAENSVSRLRDQSLAA